MIIITKWIYIIIRWYLYLMLVGSSIGFLSQLDIYIYNDFKDVNPYNSSLQEVMILFIFSFIGVVIIQFVPKALTTFVQSVKNRKQIAKWLKEN